MPFTSLVIVLWVPVLYVCIFESINTQRYLNRGETHYRNKHRRDILIITLFVGNHASLSSHSIHFFHPPRLIFPSSFHISVHRHHSCLSFSSSPSPFAHLLSRSISFNLNESFSFQHLFTKISHYTTHWKKRKIENKFTIITSKSSFTFPCDEREIRLSSRNGHETVFIFIHQKRIQTRIGKNEKRANVCILADARWLSRRVEIIILRRTKLIKN